MQPPGSTLVERSSDAIAVIRLEDGVIIDVNETFSALMGFAQKELLGRNGCDLFVHVEPTSLAVTLNALRGHAVIDAVPAGFWTQSRELRVGRLSALILEVDGRPHALCTLRGSRNPVSWERCIAARVELVRLLEGGAFPGVTVRALQALGEYLQWDLSAFWQPDPLGESLDCAAVWRSPSIKWAWPKESSREATFPEDGSLLRSVWLSGRPVWVSDVSRTRRFPQTPETGGDPMRGCLAFPVVAGDRVLGVVQLASGESREPESNLLGMVDEFGRLLGWLVQDSSNQPRADMPAGTAHMGTARSPSPTGEPRELLRELADTVDRLGDLMKSIADPAKDDSTAEMPAERTASSELQPQPPFGVTLKTVSERTGVPAATLRTWERRYRVLRPRRSANGYRLYAEDDITRILQVTNLLNRGVQVSDAMAAVGAPVAEPTSNTKGTSAPQAPFRYPDDFFIEADAQLRDD
jgi:DNA-binding transcriptional MerR regulator/PAS domain-containing protein